MINEKDISAWQLTSSSLSLTAFLVIFAEYFKNSSVLVWSTGRASRNFDFRKSLTEGCDDVGILRSISWNTIKFKMFSGATGGSCCSEGVVMVNFSRFDTRSRSLSGVLVVAGRDCSSSDGLEIASSSFFFSKASLTKSDRHIPPFLFLGMMTTWQICAY